MTDEEWKNLRSQFVTFNKDNRKYKPYAFTEQGVSMLSSVINSERAIEVNINIMRLRMRPFLFISVLCSLAAKSGVAGVSLFTEILIGDKLGVFGPEHGDGGLQRLVYF